jgi:predicted Zn finger-like uncharacterized protein
MPERHQALMKTRCRECGTIFRVTPEQLRVKSGKVRCGQCQTIFNAFDTLISDEAQILPFKEAIAEPSVLAEQPIEPTIAPEEPLEIFPEQMPQTEPEPGFKPEPEQQAPAPTEHIESIEESTSAARQAGLVAARELTEVPSYNRWSERTLTGSSLGAFGAEAPPAARWPYVLVALPLLFVLIAQLVFYFRSELVLREPAFAGIFQSLAVDVPFPRNSELVMIETSDLQSDNTRGLLLLQATLRNRASYDQAWPALELSLTDTQDAVIARRVLSVDDYRSTDNKSPVFPAQAEQLLRLTIDAKEIGAAGYRLYLFYP